MWKLFCGLCRSRMVKDSTVMKSYLQNYPLLKPRTKKLSSLLFCSSARTKFCHLREARKLAVKVDCKN